MDGRPDRVGGVERHPELSLQPLDFAAQVTCCPDTSQLTAYTAEVRPNVFIGVPRTEAAVTAQARDVDRMILFKRNLEKVCRTHAELVEQIQITVKHEIGHYLGLDEDDLERLGLA